MLPSDFTAWHIVGFESSSSIFFLNFFSYIGLQKTPIFVLTEGNRLPAGLARLQRTQNLIRPLHYLAVDILQPIYTVDGCRRGEKQTQPAIESRVALDRQERQRKSARH